MATWVVAVPWAAVVAVAAPRAGADSDVISVLAPDAALPATAVVTNAVVAICVVFVPAVAVVAVAAPNAGAFNDVMSVFAPNAAAPRAVNAAGAVIAPVPPFAMGSAAEPARKFCKLDVNDCRTSAMVLRIALLILALGQFSAMLMLSTVVLLPGVVLQSNKLGMVASYEKSRLCGAAGCADGSHLIDSGHAVYKTPTLQAFMEKGMGHKESSP